MKKIIIPAFIFSVFIIVKAQVGMGKASVDGDAILDFPVADKGIILPIVDNLPTGSAASNGTFLLDKTDNKVKCGRIIFG